LVVTIDSHLLFLL
jgi:hypothetical protein